MLDGDEWKQETVGIRPTKEDMVKFAATGAELLVQFVHCPFPLQVTVHGVVNGGEVFDMGPHWMNTADIRILHVFPPEPEAEPVPIEGVVCPKALAEAFQRSHQRMEERLESIMKGSMRIGNPTRKAKKRRSKK